MPIPNTVNDTVGYTPRNFYANENVLVDIDDDNRLDIYGDVYVNGNKLASSGFDVKSFGAVGDGIVNDTAAIQAALNAAGAAGKKTTVVLSGSHLITDNLYPHGAVDIVNGELILSGTPTNSAYHINCGIKAYGATTANGLISTWTGQFNNVKFRTTASTTAQRLVNVHNGADWGIINCVFDLTPSGTAFVGAIGCYNNANYCNPPSKLRGHIVGNSIIAAQDAAGSEGIGVGSVIGLWITDNYVYGFGDDGIGVHSCTNFVVSGNRVFTTDGRMYVSNPKDGQITHNYITRIPTPLGATLNGGGLLYLEIENASGPAPTRVQISDNIVVHAPGLTSATYGIRLRGGIDCSITGNTVLDTSGFGYGIVWESQDASALGWTDPDDTEVDQISRVRNLTVFNNRADVTSAFKIQEVGTATAVGVSSQGLPSGNYSSAVGDRTVAAGNKAMAWGILSSASGDQSTAGGNAPTASGQFSVALGDACTAAGIGSIALGRRAKSMFDGTLTFANSQFAAAGDAQISIMVARCQTTTATPVKLGLVGTGGSGLLILPDQTTWLFTVYAVARNKDTDGESAAFQIQGVIDRQTGAATTALVAAVTPTVVARDIASWTIVPTADTTNGALALTCTGEAGKTIYWLGRVELVEVSG